MSFYLNRVVRSDYGQALNWNFLCSISYWCGGRSAKDHTLDEDLDAKAYGVPVEEVGEAVHATIKEGKGIAIRGLYKQFGEKTAVNNLNLTMYTNQITALLGKCGLVIIPFVVTMCFLYNTVSSHERTQWSW